MIPRSDPETRPVAAGTQLLQRRWNDRYGAERRGKCAVYRPFHARNGLTVRPYVYRGAGYCMTEEEAELALTGTVSEAKECLLCSD